MFRARLLRGRNASHISIRLDSFVRRACNGWAARRPRPPPGTFCRHVPRQVLVDADFHHSGGCLVGRRPALARLQCPLFPGIKMDSSDFRNRCIRVWRERFSPWCLLSRRILVVDDNPDSADALGDLLESMGQQVSVVYSGESGVEIAREQRPQVAFIDLMMPG